jgi:hypothetical protein
MLERMLEVPERVVVETDRTERRRFVLLRADLA